MEMHILYTHVCACVCVCMCVHVCMCVCVCTHCPHPTPALDTICQLCFLSPGHESLHWVKFSPDTDSPESAILLAHFGGRFQDLWGFLVFEVKGVPK